MSFALRQGGSHQFERQDNNGSSWTGVGLCHKCSRPFFGPLTQSPVCCRACNFVACQGCASNQADWESKFRCASAKTSAISYQDLEDIGEPQARARSLPASVQEYRKTLMAKHDQLLDCIRELRATTHKYREEVESAFRACAVEMDGAYTDHNLGLTVDESDSSLDPAVPSRMIEVVNDRLTPCTKVLAEQASAVRDLSVQMCANQHPAATQDELGACVVSTDPDGPAVAIPSVSVSSNHAHSGSGAQTDVSVSSIDMARSRMGGRMGSVSVSTVPIVGGVSDSGDAVDVARLLHKVYQYRSDAEIEEGLCARLSTVLDQQARDILPQVERMLPALTNVILYSEEEMVYLTREIVRLCMSSLHFASRFMWCLRTSWPKEPRFAEKVQQNMCTSTFDSPLDKRLAKLLWLATIAITLTASDSGREDLWKDEYHLLSLAVEPGFNKYEFKAAVARALRLTENNLTANLAANALFIPFVACASCTRPPHSCLVLSRRQELAVVTEPLQERLTLGPGRYTLEVVNLDTGSGSTRVARILFAVELPGCVAEAFTELAGSGESVVLHLDVPAPSGKDGSSIPGASVASEAAAGPKNSNMASVRVMVSWRDDYQLAFAVRLAVRVEVPDFEVCSPANGTVGIGGIHGDKKATDVGRGTAAAGGKHAETNKAASKKENDLERAIRLSVESQQKEATRVSTALQALRAVAQQHKLVEELVEISRHLVRYRRSVLAGAGGVFARSGEVDSTKTLLNQELRKRIHAINRCIPQGAYMMMGSSVNELEEILCFVVHEAKSLQTPHKVHYMLTVEVRRVPNRTCAQASEGLWSEVERTRSIPYISSQSYQYQPPNTTRGKGEIGRMGQGGVGGAKAGHNALAESFVDVKHELHDADPLLPSHLGGGKEGGSGGSCGSASHGKQAKAMVHASSSPFGESWSQQKEVVRQHSEYAGRLGSEWDCRCVIVKSHDDLRQDQLAAELLFLFDRCFRMEKLDLPMRPYAVLATCEDGGMLETITDALAIDTLKKKMASSAAPAITFAECFEKVFGGKGTAGYVAAQRQFVLSMAAYSVFCYVLHIKDRHNGNIMLCRDGAIAHVDFGIMLNVRYAKDVLELKIKLSSEFVQVIGDKMDEFEDACRKGYLAIRKHSRQVIQMLEMSSFSGGAGTALPCLEGDALVEVTKRLKLDSTDRDAELHMMAELQKAKEHFSTGLLDQIHNWTHANV